MRRVLGTVLLLAGLAGYAIYLLGLFDPAGAKLADDADPFGAPGSRLLPAAGLFACLALVCVGAWLARRRTPGPRR